MSLTTPQNKPPTAIHYRVANEYQQEFTYEEALSFVGITPARFHDLLLNDIIRYREGRNTFIRADLASWREEERFQTTNTKNVEWFSDFIEKGYKRFDYYFSESLLERFDERIEKLQGTDHFQNFFFGEVNIFNRLVDCSQFEEFSVMVQSDVIRDILKYIFNGKPYVYISAGVILKPSHLGYTPIHFDNPWIKRTRKTTSILVDIELDDVTYSTKDHLVLLPYSHRPKNNRAIAYESVSLEKDFIQMAFRRGELTIRNAGCLHGTVYNNVSNPVTRRMIQFCVVSLEEILTSGQENLLTNNPYIFMK